MKLSTFWVERLVAAAIIVVFIVLAFTSVMDTVDAQISTLSSSLTNTQ